MIVLFTVQTMQYNKVSHRQSADHLIDQLSLPICNRNDEYPLFVLFFVCYKQRCRYLKGCL